MPHCAAESPTLLRTTSVANGCLQLQLTHADVCAYVSSDDELLAALQALNRC